MTDDNDLIESEFDSAIQQFGDSVPAALLPERARTLVCIVTSKGIIDNGGFGYLLETELITDPDFLHTRLSYQRVNAIGAVDAINQLFIQFPLGKIPDSIAERVEQWNLIPIDLQRAINRRFWTEDVWSKLAFYLRTNI